MRILSWDHGFRKPDPHLFRMALAGLEVTPAEAVYIGHHPYRDICGARQVGMRASLLRRTEVVMVGRRACEPDRIVHNRNEATYAIRRG